MLCRFNGTLLVTVLPPLLGAEIVLGVLGNGLALWIFWFHLKPWKSSTVLLFNLALADLLLLAALPLRVSYYLSELEWNFGNWLCNICCFMLALNRSGSSLFLMAIAMDRYMRVVHPHHQINSLSISKAACGAVMLWLVPLVMNAHVFTLKHENRYCESFMITTVHSGNLTWHQVEYLLFFFLPLLVILVCTVRIIGQLRGRQLSQNAKTKKALCSIIVVVVLFILCFLPSNIIQVIIWIKTRETVRTHPESEVCPALEYLNTAFFITISLTYLNSALDPLVYYFSSPVFKNVCRTALHLPQADTIDSTEMRTREMGSQQG